MTSWKKLFLTLGRLPLLFIIDSVSKGTFLDFSELTLGPFVEGISLRPEQHFLTSKQTAFSYDWFCGLFVTSLWMGFVFAVVAVCVTLVLCPVRTLLDVYRCICGFGLLSLSQKMNRLIISGMDEAIQSNTEKSELSTEPKHVKQSQSSIMIFLILLVHALLGIVFYRLCVKRVFKLSEKLKWLLKYPVPFFLHVALSSPVVGHSIPNMGFYMSQIIQWIGILPLYSIMLIYVLHLAWSVINMVIEALRQVKGDFQEIGIDGLIMRVTETIHLSFMLRIFFITRLHYQLVTSKTLSDYREDLLDLNSDEFFMFVQLLVQEILYELCGTLIAVMSLASIISVVASKLLDIVYLLIGAEEEDTHHQPAVLGLLFVLLALQTGMTATTPNVRLELLLQNCILLVIANQHYIQSVTNDMIIKASTEEVSMKRHMRPMVPYILFFSFPFLVVARLWDYPFRVSWLLAISTFTLELVIKSLTTVILYCVNMLHTRRNYFLENIDDLTFYIKAVSGCLDFICVIFLFVNGAYIFFFESGGFVRFTMMIVHFYCNIYQTAAFGLRSLKLRRSALEKVNNFPSASQEQLDENDDICPICYQEMIDALVIPCGHVFHKNCLRKWLTIQEKCPLCHTVLDDQVGSGVVDNNVRVADDVREQHLQRVLRNIEENHAAVDGL